MKKNIIRKIFEKSAKKEKTVFITVNNWGKEYASVKDGLQLLPCAATVSPRA